MPGTAAIIGSGVVGSACALALQRAGYAVTLIDPMREASGASWGNAGHIAIEQIEPWASRAMLRSVPRRLFARGGALDFRAGDWDRWLPFAWRLLLASSPQRFERGKSALASLLARSSDAWRRLASELEEPELYAQGGHFVVWETEASAARGLAHWQAAATGTARFRIATTDERARIGALLRRPPAGAIRFINTGQIADPGLLATALSRKFETSGGRRRYERASGVHIENKRATIALDGGETIAADVVLVAAGIGSADLMLGAGHRTPLIAERGYHIQSEDSQWPGDLGPIVFEDRSMIVTRFRSGLRAASFVEFAHTQSPPDPRKWARLRGHVEALGLPFVLPGKPWMGCRPTLPDYLPAIGRSTRAGNLLYAFGHQHLGLTLAPITAELIAALATGAPLALEPFRLERFG
ncbi:MAG TPA: FAD-binding oxidoreductase [Rhizomicrobium sp.]|jgi:glycine/D-amino acid oxidase-like deaminating enzyme|nr:FAD-binding oxidoreductase [Rhizomicrobium sp.]